MQDFGMICLLREMFPNLEIHASTQTNASMQETLSLFADLGVKRVVFPREMSLEEIEEIKIPIEKDTVAGSYVGVVPVTPLTVLFEPLRTRIAARKERTVLARLSVCPRHERRAPLYMIIKLVPFPILSSSDVAYLRFGKLHKLGISRAVCRDKLTVLLNVCGSVGYVGVQPPLAVFLYGFEVLNVWTAAARIAAVIPPERYLRIIGFNNRDVCAVGERAAVPAP